MHSLKPLALGAALLMLLTACAPGQAPETSPAPEPESPSSVSAPAPEPEPEPEPSQPESSEPEPQSESEPEPVLPEEPSSDPNGPWENPDTTTIINPNTWDDPEAEAAYAALVEREGAIQAALEPLMEKAKDCYESYQVYPDDETGKVCLEVAVTDEKELDRVLGSYQGEPWDTLLKKEGRCSLTQKEAFAQAVEQLELEPGIRASASAQPHEPYVFVVLGNMGSREKVERWSQLPQAIKDLAGEMGVPEELLEYMAPVYVAPGTNPDT